jgi:predicted enzyme related to lactoylglutathione lyase
VGPPAGNIGELRFLYVGVGDTTSAVAFYTSHLGARLRWRFQRFGADVAGVELGAGPLVLLADHRPSGTVLPIYVVDDLTAAVERLHTAGAAVVGPMGTPEGDAIVIEVRDGSGATNELALLEVVRPDALDHAYADPTNDHRVRDDPEA